MQKKNLSRRIAALSLAGLLILSAGCGSANEPAADEPSPSQAVAAPTPSAEPAPEITPASSPTDVNAPGTRLPAPELSMERQIPESLNFLTSSASFTLTNSDGQTLSYDGSAASGTMNFSQQQLSEGGGLFSAQIPYSDHFTCEFTGSAQSGESWGLEIVGTGSTYNWCHCVARGDGGVQSLEYHTSGQLIVRGEPGSELELTVPMPDSVLGESGWIRISFTSADQEVLLTANGSILSFSGLSSDSSAPVSIDYGGFISGQGKTLELTSGYGMLDITNIADNDITVVPSET